MKNPQLILALVLCLVLVTIAYRPPTIHEIHADGDELRELLNINTRDIIVSVWFRNDKRNEELNNKNQLVITTIKALLARCHPKVIYTQADLSSTNPRKYEFVRLAKDWNLKINKLKDGPMIMVMHRQDGEIHWSTPDIPLNKLVEKVQRDLQNHEIARFGTTEHGCMVDLDYVPSVNRTPPRRYEPYAKRRQSSVINSEQENEFIEEEPFETPEEDIHEHDENRQTTSYESSDDSLDRESDKVHISEPEEESFDSSEEPIPSSKDSSSSSESPILPPDDEVVVDQKISLCKPHKAFCFKRY
ncbi:unnamed protein product [Moneuplotes crassus]|uniref:Uncharacterized protein n=1 Tax=Euplotes crassus TaxID=5936 RepID=A0AAD1XQ84_EUPCR|nr:unnamed protein product [Moneuplotes crassus]